MLVWMNQGPTLQGDFLSVTLIEGKPELSYNLGKKTKPVRITSEVIFNSCVYMINYIKKPRHDFKNIFDFFFFRFE